MKTRHERRKRDGKPIIPTEAEEQKMLFEWAAYNKVKYPALDLMYHIPNEAKRTPWGGYEQVQMGLRKGVPDICLPVPSGRYTALYIEMKRRKGGRVSDEQRGWIAALNRVGCKAVVCRGWEEARREIENYLRI